jgi:hypothetical protein
MARSSQASEFNTFVGGLVTEASPLTFPENTALDINNFEINKNGTLRRRLGMDFEDSHVSIDSGISTGIDGEIAVSSFNWNNAGGDNKLKLIVIQTGKVLKFFNTNGSSISGGLVYTIETIAADNSTKASATVVDGILVVAVGSSSIYRFNYNPSTGVTYEVFSLKVRDTFGTEALGFVTLTEGVHPDTAVDLREPANINLRPDRATAPQAHVYNLRNSTYALGRMSEFSEAIGDPLARFTENRVDGVDQATNLQQMPSNADSVTSALFPDPEDADDRFSERFFASVLRKSPRGNFESPTGYFIIDALSRGASRLVEANKLELNRIETNPTYYLNITELPEDRTPGGATLVSEFGGRVWYGGFSGEVIDGDRHSPKLSSYVMYSKLINSGADLGICHQVGDPTSKEMPDLVDTDGGFIRLDGAYGLKRLINIGSALVIVAENGVWAVLGGSEFGFTATANKVVKVTEHGCSNSGSVVLVDGTVVYWGDDGIYQISPNDVGSLKETNLSNSTIQTLYESIPDLDKLYVQGHYDTYERKVRWLYGNRVGDASDTVELVLDFNVSAFYKNVIPGVATGRPNVVALVEVPPFKIGSVTHDVYDGAVQVFHNSDAVQVTANKQINGLRESKYLTIIEVFPTIVYTFASYKDDTFVDWKTQDGTGVDSPAFILTGYAGLGDYQRYKQIPYITFHFNKTEDGFFTDGNGDIFPLHESSCKVQAQWEWANSITSGRWGREFQAYRHKRAYIPANDADTFDNGFSTVVSKSKLRGKGKVVSLLIQTEPLKDCQILGWSTITSGATNV